MPVRERLIACWDARAADYTRRTAPVERRFLAESRRWVCEQAEGDTLELAVGTGLNLRHYSPGVRLTALDWSERMVQTTRRSLDGSRQVALVRADAMALPFADGRFDTVVCTFSLCCVPDERAVIGEAVRMLRPGGSLLLTDHIVAATRTVRLLQRLAELVTVPLHGEHFTRRPLDTVRRSGLDIVQTQRLAPYGAIERLHARKPA